MRARFITWRWWSGAQDNCDAEMADLQESRRAISAGPRCRAANWASPITRAIATTRPVQQFEALQAIDPDDLAAHYNLAVIYRRMGMKEKAAEQAAHVRHQAGRSRRAHLLAGFSAQASRDFDRERTLAHAYRYHARRRMSPAEDSIDRASRRRFHPLAQPHGPGASLCRL